MRVYLYDILRTLRNPSVVAVIVIATLLGLVVLSVIAAPVRSSSPPQVSMAFYYAGGFHLIVFTGDDHGNPQPGLTVRGETWSGSSNSTIPPTHRYMNRTSDAAGLTHLDFDVPPGVYGLNLTVSSPSYNEGWGTSLNSSVIGISRPGFGNLEAVRQGLIPETVGLLAFFEGPNGTVPSGYEVGYRLANIEFTGQSGAFPLDQSTLLGRLTGYRTVFPVNLPGEVSPNLTYQAEIFDPSGSPVAEFSTGARSMLPPPIMDTLGGRTFQFVASELGLFVPLLAIVASYGTYGKDRITGILESVLVRPVTRARLALARYLAIGVAIGIGTALELAVLELTLTAVLGVDVPVAFLFPLYGALLSEGLAFTGLLLFSAQLLRSLGGLIGVAIALFLAFALFWSVIILLLAVLFGHFDAMGFLAYQLDANFLSPAGMIALVDAQLLGVRGGLGGPNPGPEILPAAQFGVTPVTIALMISLWVGLPLLGFAWLARSRD